jgi:hypothetical protein
MLNNRLIIVRYSVIPAEAGIQAASGCRIKSGMTKRQEYYETVNKYLRSLLVLGYKVLYRFVLSIHQSFSCFI